MQSLEADCNILDSFRASPTHQEHLSKTARGPVPDTRVGPFPGLAATFRCISALVFELQFSELHLRSGHCSSSKGTFGLVAPDLMMSDYFISNYCNDKMCTMQCAFMNRIRGSKIGESSPGVVSMSRIQGSYREFIARNHWESHPAFSNEISSRKTCPFSLLELLSITVFIFFIPLHFFNFLLFSYFSICLLANFTEKQTVFGPIF